MKDDPLGSRVLGSILTMMNTIMGITFLSMGYVFKTTGLGLGVVIFAVLFAVFSLSVVFMIPVYQNNVKKESDVSQEDEFHGITREMIIRNGMFHIILVHIGRQAQMVMAVLTFISTFATVAAFVVGASEIWQELLEGWGVSVVRREYVVLVIAGLSFPIMFIRRLRDSIVLSSVSIVIMVYMTICVIIRSCQNSANWAQNLSFAPLVSGVGDLEIFASLPIITFALTCQMNTFTMFSEMAPSIRGKRVPMIVVSVSGLFFSTALYILIGVFSYLQFGASITDNILELYAKDDILMQTVKILVSLKLLFTVPVMSNPMISAAEHLVIPQEDHKGLRETWTIRTIAIIVTWILFTGLSLATSDLAIIFGVAGSLADTVISFIFPGWLFMAMIEWDFRRDGRGYSGATFLIYFGFFMLLVCAMSSIWESASFEDLIVTSLMQSVIFVIVGVFLLVLVLVHILWSLCNSTEKKSPSTE